MLTRSSCLRLISPSSAAGSRQPPQHNKFGWEEVSDSSTGLKQGHLVSGASFEPEGDSQLDFIPSMKSGCDQHVHQDLKMTGRPQELKEEKRNN